MLAHYFPDQSQYSDLGHHIASLDLADSLAPLLLQREEECKEQLPTAEEEMRGVLSTTVVVVPSLFSKHVYISQKMFWVFKCYSHKV